MGFAAEWRTLTTLVRGKQYINAFYKQMTKNKYFQTNLMTHLTELRDPLFGHDPQFGKRCSTVLYDKITLDS